MLAVLRKNDDARKIAVDKVVILIPIKRNNELTSKQAQKFKLLPCKFQAEQKLFVNSC